jgi:serine/threonine protein kinase
MNYPQSLGFEVRSLLGSGSFAQVYECFDPKENKTFAVKVRNP